MSPEQSEQTELLRAIWNEMKALGQNLGSRIDQTNERLDQTNERLDALQAATRTGFELMERRFDNLLLGEHGREHAELRERMVRLEQQVAASSPGGR